MKKLVIDIETAPNIAYTWTLWKPNVTTQHLIEPGRVMCFAYQWFGSADIGFNAEWHATGHQGMIDRAWELINEADAVITYNGKSFDRKWLNAEFLLAGMQPPSPAKDIDLLATMRKQFMLPSRKLDYVSQRLGIGEKVEHAGMPLWHGVLGGDESAQALMETYNVQDVRLTSELYLEVLPWIDNHINAGLFVDDSEPRCTNCASSHIQRRGFAVTQHSKYRRYQCTNCGRWLRGKLAEKISEMRPAV